MKLNIGCGDDLKPGYINQDISKEHNPDIVFDLNKFPYPYKDNTFDVVFAQNVLEHLPDVVRVMEELHRICKPNAKVIVIVPFYNCYSNTNDFTHCHSFNLRSFDKFTDEYTGAHYSEKRFKIVRKELRAVPWLRWFPKRLLNFWAITWGNIAEQINFELEAKK